MTTRRTVAPVLGIPIDALSWSQTTERVVKWATARESRYVAICNAHVTVSAVCNPAFRQAVSGADMALPDGAPVAWMLRRQGYQSQGRISGPDLMERLLQACSQTGVRVYFYGSTQKILAKMKERFLGRFPSLDIAGMTSPPFRTLTIEEDRADVQKINASGAGIIFVGLGCPKQELWMAAHRSGIKGVMIGVGAAFDFHAGTVQRAPLWMRNWGLEWFHRLLQEPTRLGGRYLVTNTLFILFAVRDLLKSNRHTSV